MFSHTHPYPRHISTHKAETGLASLSLLLSDLPYPRRYGVIQLRDMEDLNRLSPF